MTEHRLTSFAAEALSVPLRDPFVIATATVEVTQSVLVRARFVSRGGVLSDVPGGLGEGAALPPVTSETQEDAVGAAGYSGLSLTGLVLADGGDLAPLTAKLDEVLAECPVARAAVEGAVLDGFARRSGVPLRVLLGGATGAATRELVTDVTIPILARERMVELAASWRAKGFTCFKVKVGKDADADLAALEAIAGAVPGATFRLDANAGFAAKDAIAVARAALALGLSLECFEQPCAADDLDGMAEVAHELEVPVVADESVATEADLARVVAKRAADGVNLKLAKTGGPLRTLALGRAARGKGLKLMMGGMVETRLGMTTAAHVAAALGGVDWVDLDTAWLLADDPFTGGYQEDGPRYTLGDGAGVDVAQR